MTAIAYRNGVLAVDREVTWGNVATSTNKVHRVDIPGIGLCLVAMSGKLRPVTDIIEHLSVTPNGRKEPFSDLNPDSRYGIAITQDLVVYPIYGDGKLGLPDTNEFIAEGSAFEFLMGTMAAGCSAEEAVRLSCEYCSSCGQGVNFYDVAHTLKRA
ncbi:TPA: hypothetical protein HFD65_003301 [Escherichia coli]|nr:hypothetical protein [Escherichia coli]